MADGARLAELRGLLRIGVLHALIRSHPDSGALAHTIADALLPVVSAWAEQDREQHAARRAAEEIEQLADRLTWVTERDNEVVSARDLYEQVARLRGELDPVTYDFPPDAAALTPATEEKL